MVGIKKDMEDKDVGGGIEGDDLGFELVTEGGLDGEEASDGEVVRVVVGGGGGGVRGHIDDLLSFLLPGVVAGRCGRSDNVDLGPNPRDVGPI